MRQPIRARSAGVTSLILVAALAAGPAPVAAHGVPEAAGGPPPTADLGRSLGADGAFLGAPEVGGSVDASAWTLVSDLAAGEPPRFAAAGGAAATPIGPWSALGSNGAGDGALNSAVYAIATSGTNLYVGGSFTDAAGIAAADRIARWNGSAWSALGSNGAGDGALNNTVDSLVVTGGDLYVGGNFTNAAGLGAADNLARWDGGAWSAVGSDGAGDGALDGTVNALVATGGDLYAGGFFRNAAGLAEADGVAKWSGGEWSAVGSNVAGDGVIGEAFPVVNDLAVSGANLYMAGGFHDLAGIPEADNVARWNGSAWSALGSDGSGDGAIIGIADALAVSGSNLYVGGVFDDAAGIPEADAIARWNGSAWSALGSNGSGDGALSGNYVNDLALSGTDLYVGGAFPAAGGVAAADNVALWNGSAWSALGSDGAAGGALDDQVFAVHVAGVNLYVGGWFADAAAIATADFAAAWSLGSPVVPAAPTRVTAIARNGGALVTWLAPASDGGSPITASTVTSAPGGLTCTTVSTSCWVMGLTNGTPYTFTVTATNLAGPGPASAPSIAVTPEAAAGPAILAISAGSYQTCALLAGGSVACWGLNAYGELGARTTTVSPSPVVVSGISGAIGIAAGDTHTCALIAGGTIACWGANHYGQLGDGTTTASPSPVVVSGISGATAITAGLAYTCALLAGGSAKCWGQNSWGELGDGTTTDRTTPVTVTSLAGATAIDAGDSHTCAVVAAGAVKCWGENFLGELGDGTQTDRHAPVSVSGLTGATAIGLGSYHSCARLTTGSVRCWGDNGFGELGDGTLVERDTSVAVSGLTTATTAIAGAWHSCALLTGGTANCWGWNWDGQLGNGASMTQSKTKVVVTGITGATAITAGVTHTCVLLADASASCWGSNDFASLGTGNLAGSLTATPVVWPAPGSPGAPLGPMALAGSTSALVSWSAPVDDGGSPVTAYSVRSAPGGKTCSPSPATGTSCTVSGLKANTSYRFIVVATNANEMGPAAVTAPVAPTTGTVTATILKTSVGADADSTIPVTIAWSTGLDDLGVLWYELARQASGGAWIAVSLADSASTSANVVQVPGVRYTYRVRALLYDGTTGAWVTGATVRALARQDDSGKVTLGGTGWTRSTAGSPYGGSLRFTSSAKRTARTTFTGTSIAWVSTRGRHRGKAEVWVDGDKVATVSLYRSSTAARQIVWSRRFASSGKHTVVIKVLGTHAAAATGDRVDFDAFLMLVP